MTEQCSAVVKGTDSEVRLPGLKSWLCSSLVLKPRWIQTSQLCIALTSKIISPIVFSIFLSNKLGSESSSISILSLSKSRFNPQVLGILSKPKTYWTLSFSPLVPAKVLSCLLSPGSRPGLMGAWPMQWFRAPHSGPRLSLMLCCHHPENLNNLWPWVSESDGSMTHVHEQRRHVPCVSVAPHNPMWVWCSRCSMSTGF